MDFIVYGIIAIAICGVALALYERRKGLRLVEDVAEHHRHHDREQAAFLEAQRIAAQSNSTQTPGNF